MAFVLDRRLVVCAGVIAVGALCSCGDDTAPAPATGSEQTKASQPSPYGHGIELDAGRSARFTCARDTALVGDPLAYGDSVTVGVLRCESAQAGMTCRDVVTSQGFSIAREGYRLF